MEIRRVNSADAEACLSIYNYYIENSCATFEERRLSVSEFESRVERISSNFPFLVATEDTKVVGYAYLDNFNVRSAYRFTADLSIYIDKDCLHCGIGSRLYSEIEELAKQSGFKNIIAIVSSQNTNSVLFHQKFGFKYVGSLSDVGLKFGKWLSIGYYQKKL